MKTTVVKAVAREDLSKAATKQLRKDKKVPAVLYDHGKAQNISLNYVDAKTILFTPDTYIVELEMDGQTSKAIVREAQYHPVTDKILHVDLLKVTDDKPVEVVLPIKMVGTPAGVVKGGKLMPKLRKLTVKGIPSELPEYVEVNVSKLELGTSIKVGDVKFENLMITTSPSAAIASVEIPRALRSAGAGAADEEGEEEEGAEEGETPSEE